MKLDEGAGQQVYLLISDIADAYKNMSSEQFFRSLLCVDFLEQCDDSFLNHHGET